MYYLGVLSGFFIDPVMWFVAIVLAYRIKNLGYLIRSFIQVLVGIVLVAIWFAMEGDTINEPLLIWVSVIFRSFLVSYLIKPAKKPVVES